MSGEGFLSRWAQRKAQARRESTDARTPVASEAVAQAPGAVAPVPDDAQARSGDQAAQRALRGQAAAGVPAIGAVEQDSALHASLHPPTGPADSHLQAGAAGGPATAQPLPALDSITPADDFSPFMRVGVDATTRNAALRTLFSDPHFNVMDGLDIYIDDYSKPSPMSAAMLRSLRQSHVLGLFDNEPDDGSTAAGLPAGAPVAVGSERAGTEPADSVQDGAAQADMRSDQQADRLEVHKQPADTQAADTDRAACGPVGANDRSDALAGSIAAKPGSPAQESDFKRSCQTRVSLAGQTAGPRALGTGTIHEAEQWPQPPATGG